MSTNPAMNQSNQDSFSCQ